MLNSFLLLLPVFLVCLLLILTGAYGLMAHRQREERESVPAGGTVVSVRTRRRSTRYGGSSVSYPTVRFFCGGEQLTLEGPAMHRSPPPGRTVGIRYEAGNPSHFHLAEDDTDLRLGRKMVRIGLAVLALALLWLLACFLFPSLRS